MMKNALLFFIGAICGAALVAAPRVMAHLHAALQGGHRGAQGNSPVHTEEAFAFTANAPMEKVAPLFGADKERVWVPKWNPQFVYPVPASDGEGMVFTVAHDHLQAVWVNTLFDQKNGRFQYVYVIPEALLTVINLKLTPQGDKTHVEVQYDRTALSTEAESHVRYMAEGDRKSGPEWEKRINAYLSSGDN
jgi:hypothetical protein